MIIASEMSNVEWIARYIEHNGLSSLLTLTARVCEGNARKETKDSAKKEGWYRTARALERVELSI